MNTDPQKAAKEAVELIVEDLSDRRGLRHEWEQIDPDIQHEIREAWEGLVARAIENAKPKDGSR